MKREKFKLFIVRYGTIILIVGICAFIALAVHLWLKFNITEYISKLSDTNFAVLGTLLGAIVGGVFTLIGTNYTNKQHLKAQTQIKKKNLIYKPLYDELVEIQNQIFVSNPFPQHININKHEMVLPKNSPQYTVWDRIKDDSRYLETPNHLKKEMEKLYQSIYLYTESMQGINEILSDILNQILESEYSTKCTIMNIGSCIAEQALTESNSDILEHYSDCLSPKVELAGSDKARISELFYAECLKNEQLSTIKERKKALVEQQEHTIELLATLILIVNKKYEG